MTERKAVYYGQVELIPGIVCDGYVLDDDTAVMSERGTADLLGMAHSSLQGMAVTGVPKSLKPFIDKDLSMAVTLVKVTAKSSPYKDRKIVVYDSNFIDAILRAYVMAVGHNALQKNQMHIGRRCVLLFSSLAKTALDAAIKEACGLSPNIQQTAQKNYIDAVKLIKDFGFTCSVGDDIAIKKDITQFLSVPESTLNSFLRKHKSDIQPIRLDSATIRSFGGKASRMNGYHLDDVTKIALGNEVTERRSWTLSLVLNSKNKSLGKLAILLNQKLQPKSNGKQCWLKFLKVLICISTIRLGHTRLISLWQS